MNLGDTRLPEVAQIMALILLDKADAFSAGGKKANSAYVRLQVNAATLSYFDSIGLAVSFLVSRKATTCNHFTG